MGNFNRDHRSGGGRDFGRRKFDGYQSRDRQMFKTTCDKCGNECEVPFKPTGSRPVFCSDCFEKNGGGESRRFGDRDRGPRRPSFEGNRDNNRPQNSEQFNALNAKLDKILAILTEKSAKPAKASNPQAIEEREVIQAPAEEKTVEELIIQPKEPALVVKKKNTPKKSAPLPTTK